VAEQLLGLRVTDRGDLLVVEDGLVGAMFRQLNKAVQVRGRKCVDSCHCQQEKQQVIKCRWLELAENTLDTELKMMIEEEEGEK